MSECNKWILEEMSINKRYHASDSRSTISLKQEKGKENYM